MILLLGAGGYLGRIFSGELLRRGHNFIPLTRNTVDYADFDLFFDYVRRMKPSLIINAAGFSGKSNVNACELAREKTLYSNVILPQTIAKVCSLTNVVWAHISSTSIYSGAKILNGRPAGNILADAELLEFWNKHPDKLFGFTEWDEPNFSFRHPPCNFYSGAKALAEEAIRGIGRGYIWRVGIPFNGRDEPENFLWQIQNQSKIRDCVNSFSYTDDFARACLELWERKAPTGIYNVTNPGAISTRQIAGLVQKIIEPDRHFEFWKSDEEFYREGTGTLHSGCLMNVSKLLVAGVKIRPVQEAMEDALRQWQKAPAPAEWVMA